MIFDDAMSNDSSSLRRLLQRHFLSSLSLNLSNGKNCHWLNEHEWIPLELSEGVEVEESRPREPKSDSDSKGVTLRSEKSSGSE